MGKLALSEPGSARVERFTSTLQVFMTAGKPFQAVESANNSTLPYTLRPTTEPDRSHRCTAPSQIFRRKAIVGGRQDIMGIKPGTVQG